MNYRNWLKLISFYPVVALFFHTSQAYAQQGITWTSGLKWQKIKQLAEKENKYIFLDCYTTWCGPCKRMDKDVYTSDTVGGFFNDKFINIKVQMDKTSTDDAWIKSWYEDAVLIGKKYKITAYPTYIFLSPEGNIVHKETGYKSIQNFVMTGKEALMPGKQYIDPYQEYDSLVVAHSQGKKDFSRMIYMIETAWKLGEVELFKVWLKEYMQYLENAGAEQFYCPEVISFTAQYLTSQSLIFSRFYPDGRKVDSVMKNDRYAKQVVDRVIQKEVVMPFLKIAPNVMRSAPPDYREANWMALKDSIGKRFDKSYIDRNVMLGRIAWYQYNNNYDSMAVNYLRHLETYGIDTTDRMTNAYINNRAWGIFFMHIDDRGLLNGILKWMAGVIKRQPHQLYIDTYANLLYKAGRKAEAIQLQEKAVALAIRDKFKPDIENFQERLLKMKRNEPTW